LAGELPPRHLIAIVDDSNLYNMVIGIITSFYLAYLSNRALQILSVRPVSFNDYFHYPNINMMITNKKFENELKDFQNDNVQSFSSIRSVSAKVDSDYMLYSPGEDTKYMDTIFGNTSAYVTSRNRYGYSYMLAKDSNFSEIFRKLHLNPYYGFSCAFHYLFKPKDRLLRITYPYSSELLNSTTDVNLIRIGIEIKVDDSSGQIIDFVLNSSYYFQNFFHCILLQK
jgi:hypothetical protein